MGRHAYFDYPGAEPGAVELVFLRDWSDADWQVLLRYTQTRRFRAGDTVIAAGETDRALYVVTAGSLEVRGGSGRRSQRLAVVPTNSVVGEQAFLDGEPAGAEVIALSDGQALRLSRTEFDAFAGHHPDLARSFLFGVGELVSRRLRATTKTLLSRR